MSRHDRGRLRSTGHQAIAPEVSPRPVVGPPGPAGSSPWERVRRASAAERALLPLRFFFGATFVYAGFDKFLDPSFLDASDPSSIVAQLNAFARLSPLAPVVRVAEPWAIPVGILIALAEIAIGLGALTGLAFRLAAAGGAALSVLFWLTASWTTMPYYLGPDLPYAVGWITLALAGTGGLLVPDWVRRIGVPVPAMPSVGRTGWARAGGSPRAAVADADPARRLVLQAGVLGALALAVASMAVPVRAVRGSGGKRAGDGTGPGAGDVPTDPGAAATTSPASGPVAQGSDPPGAAPAATPATGGPKVGTTANVDAKGVVRFRVPDGVPGSLPAGDPAYLVKLSAGGYTAYDARCTHEGCRVDWDAQDAIFLCPCHGAAFDPNNHGEVLGGPTRTPLPELPIVIDPATGTISLAV